MTIDKQKNAFTRGIKSHSPILRQKNSQTEGNSAFRTRLVRNLSNDFFSVSDVKYRKPYNLKVKPLSTDRILTYLRAADQCGQKTKPVNVGRKSG